LGGGGGGVGGVPFFWSVGVVGYVRGGGGGGGKIVFVVFLLGGGGGGVCGGGRGRGFCVLCLLGGGGVCWGGGGWVCVFWVGGLSVCGFLSLVGGGVWVGGGDLFWGVGRGCGVGVFFWGGFWFSFVFCPATHQKNTNQTKKHKNTPTFKVQRYCLQTLLIPPPCSFPMVSLNTISAAILTSAVRGQRCVWPSPFFCFTLKPPDALQKDTRGTLPRAEAPFKFYLGRALLRFCFSFFQRPNP